MIRFFRMSITVSLMLLLLTAWSMFVQKRQWFMATVLFWMIHDFDIFRTLIYGLFRKERTNENEQ